MVPEDALSTVTEIDSADGLAANAKFTYETEPWEKRPGETTLWYERFQYYMMMGSSRSVPKAMQYYGHPAASINNWYREAGLFKWRERVEAWDRYTARIEREHKIKEAEEAHTSRIALINKLYTKYDKAIDDLDDDKLRWQSAGAILRAITQELREEYAPPKNETTGMEIEITDAVGTLKARLLQVKNNMVQAEELRRSIEEAPDVSE